MSCGTGEWLVLGFVLLVVLSASRMGALGNALGKFVYSFKRASKGEDLVDANAKLTRLPRKQEPEDAQVVDSDSRHRP